MLMPKVIILKMPDADAMIRPDTLPCHAAVISLQYLAMPRYVAAHHLMLMLLIFARHHCC